MSSVLIEYRMRVFSPLAMSKTVLARIFHLAYTAVLSVKQQFKYTEILHATVF